jgi:hypothetical protein
MVATASESCLNTVSCDTELGVLRWMVRLDEPTDDEAEAALPAAWERGSITP